VRVIRSIAKIFFAVRAVDAKLFGRAKQFERFIGNNWRNARVK